MVACPKSWEHNESSWIWPLTTTGQFLTAIFIIAVEIYIYILLRAPPIIITSSRAGASQAPWNEMGVLMRNEDSLRGRKEECFEPCKRRFD